ncbi:hypothetical protein TWF481_004900 [Arthrobotrys musiformis]|uniref:Uncharacterized protein n=1 Tax=Arthrobotrys musiformis TaxID=47236 RepID=A0AAV9WMI4_9PEZI
MANPSNSTYPVYRIENKMSIVDPEMPSPRYHNTIFIETWEDGYKSGRTCHVIGDLVTGMTYNTRIDQDPELDPMFFAKHFLGNVGVADYPDRLNEVLGRLPAPQKQKSFNPRTMRTEQHKSPGVFYEEGEQRPPMVKCTEWTVNQAIPALFEAGILVRATEPS